MRRIHLLAGLLVAAFAVTLLVGCGGGISLENYDRIKNGMTKAEVEGILGKGEKQASAGLSIGNLTGNAEAYVWKSGDKQITVNFVDGKVVLKTQTGL